MLIDWFTVVAQALNFLILVWLLKRFLYKPILDALDARETRIAGELADAVAKGAEATEERDEFRHKNDALDKERAALLAKATADAGLEHTRLINEAREAADALSAKRRQAMASDVHGLDQAMGRLVKKEVFAIARQALADLASTGLEERMAEVFIQRLRAMRGKARAALGSALTNAPEPALVRSAFALHAEQRTAIQAAINETFAADIPVQFETAPDVVSGIELSTNGQKVGWSIAEYLASLEKGVEALVGGGATPVSKPKAKSRPHATRKSAPKRPAT